MYVMFLYNYVIKSKMIRMNKIAWLAVILNNDVIDVIIQFTSPIVVMAKGRNNIVLMSYVRVELGYLSKREHAQMITP